MEGALLPLALLPAPVPQPGEMEDVRWFHRDYLTTATAGAVPGLAGRAGGGDGGGGSGGGGGGAGPGAGSDRRGLLIPGPYSLAHRLISGWLVGEGGRGGAPGGGGWAGDALPQVGGRCGEPAPTWCYDSC